MKKMMLMLSLARVVFCRSCACIGSNTNAQKIYIILLRLFIFVHCKLSQFIWHECTHILAVGI